MKKMRSIAVGLLAAGVVVSVYADPASPEDRLRAQLRQTMQQLQQAEDENTDLKTKLDAATQQAAAAQQAQKQAADTTVLKRQLQDSTGKAEGLQQQLDALQKSLEEWKQAYQKAATAARTRDGDARDLEAKLHESQSQGRSCEDKNAQLVKISDDLLQRYKNKGPWEALRNSEALTGLERVDLERLSQDYHAHIVDATVQTPSAANTASSAPQ